MHDLSANVFISFASQDKKVATTLCAALESRGFSCWISSRDIKPGENFQIAIVRAIRTAKMMLLVFTANSNASDEMSKELALASQQKLIVVPLRVEDVAPNEAFAYEFATRQWIDFFADWEAAINQLCVRLAQAMPPEPEEAPAEPVAVAPPIAAPPVAAPEPVPEVRPAVVAKAPVADPTPPKAEPVAAAKPPAASPKAAPTPELKRSPDVKPSPAPAAKPTAPPAAKAPASAAATPPARKPPVGLFIGLGVAAVLIVGAVVALPMLTGKKPAAQATVAPSSSVASLPSTASASPPAAAPSQAAAASAAAATLAANGAASPQTDPGATAVDPSTSPATPKPRVHKAARAAHVAAKADVPY